MCGTMLCIQVFIPYIHFYSSFSPPPPVLLHSCLPHSQPLLTLPSDVIHAKDIHVSRVVSLACDCFALLLASNLLIRILPPPSSRLPPPFPLPPLSPLTACRYCFISCSSVSFLFVFFNSLLFFEFYSRYELPAEVIYLPSSPRHLLLSLKQLNSSLPPSLSPLLLEIEGIKQIEFVNFLSINSTITWIIQYIIKQQTYHL